MILGNIIGSSSGVNKPYCININPTGNETLVATHHQSMKLGKNWMEYQGSKNWEGLLDPLDDKLRWEIMRYGKFVEVAYNSFDFTTSSSSTYATSRFSKRSLFKDCDLQNIGYRVTKNLRASSSVQLPRWTKKVSSWVTNQSSWIGYVAVCHDEKEISRLGRRDVVVAYRGTTTLLEWVENLRATLTKLPCCATLDGDGGGVEPMVESGFLSLYTGKTTKRCSLQDQVREEIRRILKSYSDEPLSLTITGHSLGAALATLTALDICTTFNNPPMVTVVSFGAPRIGNHSFKCLIEKCGCKILRIVNPKDLITKVPGFVIDDNSDDDERVTTKVRQWLQKRMEDSQWDYANVGRELRLGNRDSPLLNRPSIDVATCHELDTYLQLVDVCMSSTCPFKSTTRRVFSSSLRK